MSFPNTAEGITRYLRSKNVTTQEIYDISVSVLDGKYDIYFPNGHIFILELIIDRWNDAKQAQFRKDTNIWKLWKQLWVMVSSENHKKKLLRNLRSVNLIQLTFEEMQDGDHELCEHVYEVLKSVNSCMITAVSPEAGLKLLGRVIDIVLSCDFGRENFLKQAIISEILTFTDLNNFTEVSNKVSGVYCSELLLPSLKYFKQADEEVFDNIFDVLSEFTKRYLFEFTRDLPAALKTFVGLHKSSLSPDLLVLLFTKCITTGKCDAATLETILKMLLDIDVTICADLLATLNAYRKIISQTFLESLFTSVFESRDWKIIKSIIEMDIEIGILKTEELMNAMDASTTNFELEIWTSIINCHVNAREFTNLLTIWREYCRKNTTSLFLTDSKMTKVLSDNVPALSVTQTRAIITDLVDVIASENDIFSVNILQVIVSGLKMLSYAQCLEFRIYLSKLFEIEGFNAPVFWQLKYHVLELYDDLPIAVKFNPDDASGLINLGKKYHSSELFFALFKFYELQPFENLPVIEAFMNFIGNLDSAELSNILQTLLTRWSTLVDSSFGNKNISHLIEKLLQNHIDILPVLFAEEDFFEESNIVRSIVVHLTADVNSNLHLKYLLEIPIQCLNKAVRLAILDQIIEKDVLKEDDINVLCHVLKNPTSRSKIETDYKTMLTFVGNSFFKYSLENPVIAAVWQSALLQRNDNKASSSMDSLLQSIQANLNHTFDYNTYALLHLVLKTCDESGLHLDALKVKFINSLIYNIQHFNGDFKLLAWLLKVLFIQASNSKTTIPVPPLFSKASAIPSDIEVQSAYFMVSTLNYNDNIEYLLAQYLILRENGVSKEMLLQAIKLNISKRIINNDEDFNTAFETICNTMPVLSTSNSGAVLELLQLFIHFVSKQNSSGRHIFVKSISHLLTNYSTSIIDRKDIISFITFLNDLLVAKPFLFTQYCSEMLFPLTSKILLDNIIKAADTPDQREIKNKIPYSKNDLIFSCTHMLSSLLLFHRYKLSNRTHLINIVICQLLELLSDAKQYALSVESAKAVSRFICNYCEPANVRSSKQTTLSSAVSNVKRSLRKNLPVVLLQFIKLSVSKPYPTTIKKELMLAVYAIFDLLSQTEMNLLNASLDSNGRSYFKTLHADYKKSGKWHDD
ncbi:ribosome biogenesis protein URB2 [Kluyveromyces lactis]|uniref:KLLA0E22485p n=1 Tax=Kluyveromyces lactis (strain ATCC 8585 / CBS 2359 / DSM 70799 / NBRC 1267 / NRRL Y-1140 / WM37) TaxID=284590 RepID=Q6CM71_KLULA|nr:uncharacterized protein KLLA0_E22485g [Kluyveromyces lactis]CAH00055.1 KLLA0E22485p [Kluyveromyces lactis]|eukprot:XP_454968.1 uncharacterized protein KLLA0_E22485g [Kluyveromyces lactis]